MKNICIIYNAGSYGTFINWCLNYFSDLTFDESLPFTEIGNSHNFVTPTLMNFQGCVNFVESNSTASIVRFHPKTQIDENIIDNLVYINVHFKKIIYLIPTVDTIAWNINNKFEKIWTEGWLLHNEPSYSNNLTCWEGNNLDQMQLWEKREFLSLYIYPQHLSECRISHYPQIQQEFTKFQFVTIDSLRDNFKESILSMLEYCNLLPVRIDKFDYVYREWIKLQYHSNKDQLIDTIIKSVLNNNYYDWSDSKLTLIDEALIQYYLRENKIEIKCYNLNIFPTNATELKEYLYSA